MTEDEKIAAETAAADEKAKADAEAERQAGLSEEDKAAEAKARKEKEDSYETELAKEKERADKAEKAAAEADFKLRESKRKKPVQNDDDDDDQDDDEEDKPLTKREFREAQAANNQKVLKESQKELIVAKAKALAASDGEANLIIEIHRNRQFPADMPLDEQLEEAQALANRKKHKIQVEELKRALAGKEGESENAATTQRDAPPQPQPKLSTGDAAALKGAGFEWDSKQGMWKKLLPNKQYLYRDSKTGKIFRR